MIPGFLFFPQVIPTRKKSQDGIFILKEDERIILIFFSSPLFSLDGYRNILQNFGAVKLRELYLNLSKSVINE